MKKQEIIDKLEQLILDKQILPLVKFAYDNRSKKVKGVHGLKNIKEFIDNNRHDKSCAIEIYKFIKGIKPYQIK